MLVFWDHWITIDTNLIENKNISNINNLQIQFHNFIDDAENLRAKIRNDLSQTHQLTYDYFFVWENWKKIK